MAAIKTAICSFGLSGRVFHAPFVSLHPGMSLHGIWERSKQLAAQQYPGIITYTNLETMLADAAVELVIVNTPNYTHYDYAKQALLAGKHVIVEKPFTNTTAEAEELASLAKQQGKLLSVFQNRRFDSDFKTVQKVVREQRLGTLVEAEIHFDRYNLLLSPKAHKENGGPGTGILYDLGSHIIDQALHLFGMPEALFADLQSQRPHSQIDDYMELLLFYPGLRVRLKGGYLVREPFPSYTLHGTKGSLLKSRADVQETQLQSGMKPDAPAYGTEPGSEQGLLHTEENGQVTRQLLLTEKGQYMEYYDRIQKAIRSGESSPVTAEEGVQVIRIIETAISSHHEKRIIAL